MNSLINNIIINFVFVCWLIVNQKPRALASSKQRILTEKLTLSLDKVVPLSYSKRTVILTLHKTAEDLLSHMKIQILRSTVSAVF